MMSTTEVWVRRAAALFVVIMALIALNNDAFGTVTFLLLSAIIFQLVNIAEIIRGR